MEEENKDINQSSELENSMFSNSNDDSSSMFSNSLFGGDAADNTEESADDLVENEAESLNQSALVDDEQELAQENTQEEDNINPPSFFEENKIEDNEIEAQNNLNEQEEDISEDFSSFDVQENEIKEDTDDTLNDEQIQDNSSDSLITVRPVKFQHFKDANLNLSIKKNLDILQDVPMHITVELGRTKSTIKEIINMDIGSIVELDKIAGEQVEIYVNEKLVARGEVIVIEDKFGVRVVNTNIPKANI